MLSVILGILKIIGTVLLWILAVFLVILLLILFVPIRYNGRGSYDQKGDAEIRAGWLFRLIHFQFTYHGKPEASAGILWFRIWKWPSGEDLKEGEDSAGTVYSGSGAENGKTETAGKTEASEKPEETAGAGYSGSEAGNGKTETAGKTEASEKPEETAGAGYSGSEAENGKTETAGETEESGRAAEARETAGTEETGDSRAAEAGGQNGNGTAKNAAAAGHKFSGFVKKLPDRLKTFFENLKRKWNAVEDKEKFYRNLIEDERNRRFFRFFLVRVKRILKDLLPRRISGNLCFGFEDPYTTGQVLSYAALLLPWYHDKLKIVPVFEHQELKADVSFKGRIYLFILLVNGLSVWFNRDFRRIYRKLKKRRR